MKIHFPSLTRVQHSLEVKVHNPYKDWFIVVVLFFACVFVALAWSIGFYRNIDQGKIFRLSENATPLQPQLIDRAALKTVSGYYIEQSETLSSLLQKKGQTEVDPAL